MLKTYKYRIKPNEEQIILLNKHFGSIRFVYNYFLNERKREYETNKQSLTYVDNARSLTQLKKDEDYSWLKEINSQSLQSSLKNLDGAYNGFFKKRTQFPRFKSKHNKNSFCVPQFVKLESNNLIIPKFKDPIKVVLHRVFQGNIKQCTISKTPANEYFVSILVETEHKSFDKTGKQCGIDLGLKDFAITSDGKKYKNNRYAKRYTRKLKQEQQNLSRKQKDSSRYNKQKLKVARLHKKITNSRNDNLHKVSTELIKKYDIIFLEDLNVKGMMSRCKPKKDKSGKYLPNKQSAKSGLNRSIADASWSKFAEMLTYKAKWNNKEIVQIGRFYPSSKACHNCGYINQGLTLKNRSWTCPECNKTHNRDINAAINILIEGQKIISAGTVDYRRGDKIRPLAYVKGTVVETSKIQG